MNKTLLRYVISIAMLYVVLTSIGSVAHLRTANLFADTASVTFQVNMRILMEEGKFLPGSNDTVWVRGNFNNWGTTALTDGNNDSIYTGTVDVDSLYGASTVPFVIGDTIQYKYFKTLRSASDWESVSNRMLIVDHTPINSPVVYFNDDSVYVAPPADVPVTFQVNMKVKMLEGTFQPGSGDIVTVPGDINGWSTSHDTLTDLDGDSIYTKTLSITEGTLIHYKFYKTLRGGIDWESDQPTSSHNREYTIPTGGGPIPPVYFDNDSVVNIQVNANVNWQVDMTTYLTLGWFQPAGGDTMEVRGPFNGWGGTMLSQDPFITNEYDAVAPISGAPNSDIDYKFYIKLNPATAESRFPGYGTNNDGVQYEHPAERGDGNRKFNIGSGGNLSSTSYFFSSINPNGIIPANDTVMVTLKVNMGPATRYIIPFDPNNDTVKLIWQDALWRAVQTKAQGSFPDLTMAPVSAGDTVFQVTFPVIGPTHYNMQYTFRYIEPGGGTQVDQGGGLGGQNLFNSRYIQPISAGVFPANYSAPTDEWQKSAPLPFEAAPFSITGVRDGKTPGVPAQFKLEQNYPNPFNPMTRINYSIPNRSNVSLKVFNLLGQQVATLVNEQKERGNYFVQFDATSLASGVYYYRVEAGTFRDVKKMVLIK